MNILITGGNSGIGKCIADYLFSKGLNVKGTSRKPSKTNNSKVSLIELDITSKDSIKNMLLLLEEIKSISYFIKSLDSN